MISKLWLTIAGWASAVAAVVLVLFQVRQSGKESARRENIDKTLEGVKVRDEVENDVSSANTIERERLRNKWTRK